MSAKIFHAVVIYREVWLFITNMKLIYLKKDLDKLNFFRHNPA